MEREVIIVLGKTGYGKSLWQKCYLEGQSRLFAYDPLLSVRADYRDAEEWLEEFKRGEPKVFRVGISDAGELPIIGEMAMVAGHCILSVEECSTVFPKGLANLPEWARNICFLGRHAAVSIMLVAQRPVSIPVDFRSQASRIITFSQHEDGDLGWLVDFFGRDRVADMPYLPKWTCFDYWDGHIASYSIVQQVRDRLGIKLDSGAALSVKHF